MFFFSSRRRHTRCSRDWSSDVCSSDLALGERLVGSRDVGIRGRGGEFGEQAHGLFESKSFGGKGERGQLCGGGWQLPVGKEKKDGFKCGFRDARAQRAAPLQLPQGGVALAGGFVEDDRSGRRGGEGLNGAGQWDGDAGGGRAPSFFWAAGRLGGDAED